MQLIDQLGILGILSSLVCAWVPGCSEENARRIWCGGKAVALWSRFPALRGVLANLSTDVCVKFYSFPYVRLVCSCTCIIYGQKVEDDKVKRWLRACRHTVGSVGCIGK